METQPSDSGDPKPAQNNKHGISNEGWDLINFLYDNPNPQVLKYVAASINISESRATHIVETLQSFGLADVGMTWQIAGPMGFEPVGYFLTPKARALIASERNG